MPRHPATRDCGIKGCTRAEYRMGLCRHHHTLVPVTASYALCAEVMLTSHKIAQKHHRFAIRRAQRIIDQAATPPKSP